MRFIKIEWHNIRVNSYSSWFAFLTVSQNSAPPAPPLHSMTSPLSFQKAEHTIHSSKYEEGEVLKFEKEDETVVLDVRGLIYHPILLELMVLYGTMMVWPLRVAVKMREILTSSLSEICWSAKGKTYLSSVCKSLIGMGKCKWVCGWHYFVVFPATPQSWHVCGNIN